MMLCPILIKLYLPPDFTNFRANMLAVPTIRPYSALLALLFASFLLGGCGSYRQNLLFQTNEQPNRTKLDHAVWEAEKNHVIRPNDWLKVEVYTNDGERIIDPDMELMREMPMNQAMMRREYQYLVMADGRVRLPKVGDIPLKGLNIYDAARLLEKEYAAYYQKPMVIVKYLNNRVIVLGATEGKVIPLDNENTTLIEVIALAGGINNQARGTNIRWIRDQEVRVIDLTQFDGIRQLDLTVKPGDIVFVEPIRRPLVESIRDYGPLISVTTSMVSLVILINSLNR
jgi:polysaccharide biosynthesis/export protein